MTGLPTPPTTRFQTDVAGCALSSAGQQDPRACRRPVIRAGLRLVLDPEPRLFLCFACDQQVKSAGVVCDDCRVIFCSVRR